MKNVAKSIVIFFEICYNIIVTVCSVTKAPIVGLMTFKNVRNSKNLYLEVYLNGKQMGLYV